MRSNQLDNLDSPIRMQSSEHFVRYIEMDPVEQILEPGVDPDGWGVITGIRSEADCLLVEATRNEYRCYEKQPDKSKYRPGVNETS